MLRTYQSRVYGLAVITFEPTDIIHADINHRDKRNGGNTTISIYLKLPFVTDNLGYLRGQDISFGGATYSVSSALRVTEELVQNLRAFGHGSQGRDVLANQGLCKTYLIHAVLSEKDRLLGKVEDNLRASLAELRSGGRTPTQEDIYVAIAKSTAMSLTEAGQSSRLPNSLVIETQTYHPNKLTDRSNLKVAAEKSQR